MSRKGKKSPVRWPAWYTPVERPPLPVTQVRYDGVLWTIDGSPCPTAGSTASFRRTAIRRHTETEFLLRPSLGAVLFGVVFTVFGGGILAAFVNAGVTGKLTPVIDDLGWPDLGQVFGFAVGFLLGAVCLRMSLGTLSQVTRFDKATGTMTRRSLFGTSRTVALADVVAVQAIYAGRASGGGGRGGGPYDVLQVNLIVAVGDKKVNVVSEPTERYVRKLAADVAAFLGVPLVDQIADTRKHHGQ